MFAHNFIISEGLVLEGNQFYSIYKPWTDAVLSNDDFYFAFILSFSPQGCCLMECYTTNGK